MTFSAQFLRRVAILVIGSLGVTSAPKLFAQTTATTDPVGFITLNVAGTGAAGGTAMSLKGLGLTRPVEYQGAAEAVAANSVTDNEAVWTDNQFNPAGATTESATHYLEIISGPGAGTTYDIIGTSAANKRITLGQNLAAGVAAPASFKIRKHWTIASVFGANNEGGLAGGSLSTADQILIYNGSGYDAYFYQVHANGQLTGWRNVTDRFTDAGGQKLYLEDGLVLKRKQAAATNVVLMGAVKTVQTSIPVFNGVNVLANVYAAPQTLASSGLYTGNASTGLAGGTATTADQVLLWNGSDYDAYFYQVDANPAATGWRKTSDLAADASSTQIPVGSSLIISRKGSGFNWVAPQHPATL